ncbi:hypothetical protein [Halorussus ruber]|uniref:hypothetical protein n=1 Tax=Halorussus ruber TaxID=1126238 RepID=UPI001091BF6E|nr:hypothetical protein [Halorussus ruber]
MNFKGSVYRLPDPDGKGDVLIVDSGHENGRLHIYRHEESLGVDEIKEKAEDKETLVESRENLGRTLSKLKFGKRPNLRWYLED